MKYKNVVPGIFLQRPNRFIAHVEINGREEICHVKNTGRCRELLVPGCTVYCAVSDNPQRKTKYDLIAVEKVIKNHTRSAKSETSAVTIAEPPDSFLSHSTGEEPSATDRTTNPKPGSTLLVNMDSQAPNAAVKEWLESGTSPFGKIDYLKPEYKYGNSRFDFYLECKTETKRARVAIEPTEKTATSPVSTDTAAASPRKIFLEVKGVTLEDSGVVLFPDAPTERGLKHVRELIHCHEEGFATYVLFVVQMERALYFTPNRKTHPQFADALCEAQNAGVHLLAYTCKVTPDEMKIDKELKVNL